MSEKTTVASCGEEKIEYRVKEVSLQGLELLTWTCWGQLLELLLANNGKMDFFSSIDFGVTYKRTQLLWVGQKRFPDSPGSPRRESTQLRTKAKRCGSPLAECSRFMNVRLHLMAGHRAESSLFNQMMVFVKEHRGDLAWEFPARIWSGMKSTDKQKRANRQMMTVGEKPSTD